MAEGRTLAHTSGNTQENATPRLGVALRQRHVTMISLGGIIGAGLFVGSKKPELPMWLFPWLSYAVVVAIVGVLIAMGMDSSLRPQLMASVASLAVASAAWLLGAKRCTADQGTRTGYLAAVEASALQGDR